MTHTIEILKITPHEEYPEVANTANIHYSQYDNDVGMTAYVGVIDSCTACFLHDQGMIRPGNSAFAQFIQAIAASDDLASLVGTIYEEDDADEA